MFDTLWSNEKYNATSFNCVLNIFSFFEKHFKFPPLFPHCHYHLRPFICEMLVYKWHGLYCLFSFKDGKNMNILNISKWNIWRQFCLLKLEIFLVLSIFRSRNRCTLNNNNKKIISDIETILSINPMDI